MGQHEAQERWYLIVLGKKKSYPSQSGWAGLEYVEYVYIGTIQTQAISVEEAKEFAIGTQLENQHLLEVLSVFDVGAIEPHMVYLKTKPRT